MTTPQAARLLDAATDGTWAAQDHRIWAEGATHGPPLVLLDEDMTPQNAALIAFAVNNLAGLLACREAAVGLAEAVEPLLPEVNHTGTDEACPHCERWEPVRGALAAFREASG